MNYKSFLLSLIAFASFCSWGQDRYDVYSWRMMSLNKSVGLVNGNGLYDLSSEHQGNGKIELNEHSYSIWLKSKFGDPDMVINYEITKSEGEGTIFESTDKTQLVVIPRKPRKNALVYQVQLNLDFDSKLELPSTKIIFETYQFIPTDENQNDAIVEALTIEDLKTKTFNLNKVTEESTLEINSFAFLTQFEHPDELTLLQFVIDSTGRILNGEFKYNTLFGGKDLRPIPESTMDSIKVSLKFSGAKVILGDRMYGVKSIVLLDVSRNTKEKFVFRGKFKKKKEEIKLAESYKKYEGYEVFLENYPIIMAEKMKEMEGGFYTFNVYERQSYSSLSLYTYKEKNGELASSKDKVIDRSTDYRIEPTREKYY
jgi:hypothetical protein